MDLKLGDVQETALIPLAIRAAETQKKSARITDEKAVEIIKTLNIDTKPYDKFFSHEGVVARTILIDTAVKKLISQYPDAICINMGCGLDNRFSRVDNGQMKWYDIDLPDSIMVRQKVYEPTDRVTMIAGNVLETDWTNQIPKDRTVIVIAEGLFMYFSKEQVADVLKVLRNAFPNGFLVVELMHPMMTGNGKHHDTVKNTNASFGWGTKSGHELEELSKGLKLIQEDSLNTLMKKYTFRGKLFNLVAKNLNNRIALFKWNNR